MRAIIRTPSWNVHVSANLAEKSATPARYRRSRPGFVRFRICGNRAISVAAIIRNYSVTPFRVLSARYVRWIIAISIEHVDFLEYFSVIEEASETRRKREEEL